MLLSFSFDCILQLVLQNVLLFHAACTQLGLKTYAVYFAPYHFVFRVSSSSLSHLYNHFLVIHKSQKYLVLKLMHAFCLLSLNVLLLVNELPSLCSALGSAEWLIFLKIFSRNLSQISQKSILCILQNATRLQPFVFFKKKFMYMYSDMLDIFLNVFQAIAIVDNYSWPVRVS